MFKKGSPFSLFRRCVSVPMLVVGEFQIWGEGRWELQKKFFFED